MSSRYFDPDEYLELCKEYDKYQYGGNVDEILDNIDDIYFEQYEKNNQINKYKYQVIDLSGMKSVDILKNIDEKTILFNYFKVYDFLLKITKCFVRPNETENYVNLTIYVGTGKGGELGFKLIKKFNILKDIRFHDYDWLQYFNGSDCKQMPFSKIKEIIKALQAAKKLIGFI